MSLHPLRLRWLLQDVAGLPRKAFPRKQAFVDISVFLCLRKQQPRFAQGQPKGYFLTNNWSPCSNEYCMRRPSMLSSTCQHVARLQFDSRAEKDSLCGTVMMAWIWDVWINAMVLVPWHKLLPRLAQKNCHTTVWIWSMSLHPLRLRWLLQDVAGLPRKAFPRKQAFVDISVFLCLRKQQPRFAQGQPKGYFLTKKLDRTTEALARMNIVWEGPVS